MIFPWKNERYYRNDDGLWDFMPEIHRPGGSRFLHDDWPWPFNKVPRTWTSFIYVFAELLEGDPKYWIHPETGKIVKGKRPSIIWIPKPWGLRGTYQKTKLTFKNPLTGEIKDAIYQSKTCSNGYAWRTGTRLSDDDIQQLPAWYVNHIPIESMSFLAFGIKQINDENMGGDWNT